MRWLKNWLLRRLTQPELEECRRMYGTNWYLATIDYSRSLSDPGVLVLTYRNAMSMATVGDFEKALKGEKT